ncbi:golgin subfamily A member 4 isoform X2 [Daktulosphaira vitifoliae]|uniref:golgin subfamily A member 4 isoform X2 n=1 Tax=Daktulosphaira vitifoliae TaxID=58002 RepID=UPI0021AA8E3C|nr:golgin subfamily A member 4 isoform X2 [Daktulosphaira vitifoliae]
MPKFETFHSFLLKNKIYLIKMFKKLKVTIGKNEESKLKPKTGNQESSSWSGFSSVSPNINDSQFCIDDETDDTSKDSPARVAVSESTTVDLNKFNQSSSSLVIDNHSSFHTDLESASEFDDNVSVVSEYANDITKENLYAAYKKLFGRYYKNKNKYLELNSKFKQMLLTHDKDKITMTKAQDKLLQRIVELKEQCTLEQAAKAHMEEALRNDIEERDHIISTLNTKIDLLKKKDENDESDTSLSDVIELQEKCKKLNNELISSRSECDLLQKQIETLKKSEENTLLTLAENKKEIHKELELKEDQIKKLEKIINGLQMENKILSKGNMVESFSNPNQIKIEKNLQQEISNQISDIEGEMALLFKQKENKVKELEKKIELLEQQLEVNSKLNKEYNYKDKEVEKLKSELALLEQNLNDEKLSSTKKIDTFIKEIGEKSQIIKKLSLDLKDFSKNKIDNEKSEKQVLNLRNDINRIQKLLDDKSVIISSLEKQCINIDELKSEQLHQLNEKIKHLEEKCIEKKNLTSNLKNEMGELKLKNNFLKKSEEELKLQIIEHDKSNKKLQEIIKVVQDEKEQETNTMKKMIEQNQREFDNLNSLHKEMLTQLNQDKFNKISEERTIESVVRDFSLLIEENSFLKKERQKMILVVQDILKNTKKDVFNLKSYVFNQLTEWFSIFERDIIGLKSEYSKNIKYFNDNLEDSRDKIVLIKKSFHILKTDFAQIINLFNNNVLEKSIENIITEVYKYNEKLEKKKHELIELQKEFDDFKKNEQIAVKSDMVNTLHDLQEKLNAQIKTISDLKNEHENYKAVEKKKWTDKLVETENKWVEKMDNYKKMMDTSHREEIDALTGEWNNERKHQAELNISEKKHDEDLEKIVLNVETSSQREEVLQRQVNKLNKELSEIKKMFRNEFHNKSNTNEEDENIEKSYVEMEFLRNILYEYMMGKQPMVLAKVLAAIVKFDTEQLKSVLQKEEQKVSLLKTLGLS